MNFIEIAYHIHQGKRNYQEDSFCYNQNFILVSDGVGGLAKGDIASGIVKDVWQEALGQNKMEISGLDESVQSIVQKTIAKLNAYTLEHIESMGMGATLACAAIIDGKMVCIHVGDSRIYHFSKKGEIKWRSTDHSLVQELVTGGIITEAEAATHPRRNVITRVLQAKEDLHVKAAIHVLENVENDDIILVCSDGIIESWSDDGISSVIMGGFDLDTTMKKIGDYSAENSSDNNTAVIAKVKIEPSNSEIIYQERTSDSEQILKELESGENKITPLMKNPIQSLDVPTRNNLIVRIIEKIKGITLKAKLLLSLRKSNIKIRWIGLVVMLALSCFVLVEKCNSSKNKTYIIDIDNDMRKYSQ